VDGCGWDHSQAEEAPVAARRQIDLPRRAVLPLRRGVGAGAGAALHDAVAEDVHRPRVRPAGDDARVVLRRRLYLPRVGRRRRRGLAAAEGQPRAPVLDAELDAAVQGARSGQRARRRRRREDDPLLLLLLVVVVAAVQRVRETVVVPRPPRRAALAGAVRARHEGRRRVEHGGWAHGEGRLGLGVRRGALGEGDGAGGQGRRVQQPRGGEQGTRGRTLAAGGGGPVPGPATVTVAWTGRRSRGLTGDVAPLRAGAAVHRPRSPPQDHLLDLRSQEHAYSTGPRIQDPTRRSARTEGIAQKKRQLAMFV
jgi:hypothetical protein